MRRPQRRHSSRFSARCVRTDSRAGIPTLEFIERAAFLAALAADLDVTAAGAGRTVLLSGEAGIGKTSLLEHFLGRHPDAHVFWGTCEALFTPHPLGPLHDLARESHGRLRTMLGDGTGRAELFTAVLDELMVPPAPAVLILEDIHWADAATLDLIRFLARSIHRAPALMILSYRDDELDSTHLLRSILGHLPPRHVTRLPLPRLSPAAVASLAAGMKRDAAGIHAATGGNPFFVMEVLVNADSGVPVTVRDAVLGRAARLHPAARELLEFASIGPRAITVLLVDKVLAPGAQAVDECLASGLLLADDRTLRFRHELAREAASRGAGREAAALCKVALAFADGLPDADRAALLDEYAGHCFEPNDLATAIPSGAAATALFEKLGDPARTSEALAMHAMPLLRALRNADADATSRRAIALAQTLPSGPQLARANATEAYLRMLNRDCTDAIAWGEKAAALVALCHDREVLASARNSVGAAWLFVDYPLGFAHLKATLALVAELADGGVHAADTYAMLGSGSGELYQFANANRFLADGIVFARAHDLDRLTGYMEAWQSLADVYQGRWEAAGDQANALLAREQSGSTNRLMALVALGRLRTRRGDPGAAAVLDETLALATRTGTLQRIAPVRCARAEAAWLIHDFSGVHREAQAAFDLAADKKHPWFLGELAYWLWQAGDLDEAPAACAAPYAMQISGRWREAASAWTDIGCPYEQARALAEGDASAQRDALANFDRLGARPPAERLRQQMRVAGVPAIPRGPRSTTRDNPAGLTIREVQVLALVAEGWQNARIATRLSGSQRTVEHHLAAILSKLAVNSPGDAVALARERGILPQNR